MTNFPEAFYKVYRKTQETLDSSQREWQDETTNYITDICVYKLAELHEEQVKLYEKFIQLEKLWGVYCVSYTEAVSELDKTYAEDESLKELAIITGETHADR